MWAALVLAVALAQQTPVPQPFPRPGNSQGDESARPSAPPRAQPPASPPASRPKPPATAPASQAKPPTGPPAAPTAAQLPSASAAANGAPTAAELGIPIYPTAQFIASYDAGRGQRFYLFGTTAGFTELVAYYRSALKKSGDLIFDAPATYEITVGRFREETMAFPPGVTIKEYKSAISEGYPNPKPGGQPARFPSVIQIVPVPPAER